MSFLKTLKNINKFDLLLMLIIIIIVILLSRNMIYVENMKNINNCDCSDNIVDNRMVKSVPEPQPYIINNSKKNKKL